jgi:hypothetical protein
MSVEWIKKEALPEEKGLIFRWLMRVLELIRASHLG